MTKPILVATVYAVVSSVVVPLVLSMFRAQYRLLDVIAASFAAALLTMIPTLGSVASLAVLVLLLNWRCRASLFPDIVVSVAIARLAMIPILVPFTLS